MKKVQLVRQNIRRRRTLRVRKKLRGTEAKPRLCVVKSNEHIQAQLIDDSKGIVLGSAATFGKDFKGTEFGKKSKKSAKKIGEKIAQIASEHNVKEVIFDRGRFKYHGVLVELANAAREAGLKF